MHVLSIRSGRAIAALATHEQGRRITALAFVVALIAGACGSSATAPAKTGDGPSAPAGAQPLDCERLGYPCDLADTPPELLQRNKDLLAAAGERLAAGTMADALAFLQAEPDVVEAFGSDLAVTFRIVGAPPAWLVDHSNVRSGNTGRSRSADPMPGVVPMPDIQLASVVGDDTTGDGKVDNRDDKRALVLAPYMWEFSPDDESDHLAERLGAMEGYEGNVRLSANRTRGSQQVTVDDWLSFDQYDAIFIATHGYRECGLGRDEVAVCQTVVLTGINLTQIDAMVSGTYRGFAQVGVNDQYADATQLDYELGMIPDSFRMLYPEGLDDTLLSLSACETGLLSGDELARAISPGGDDFVMFAWTEEVPSEVAFKASGVLIEQLALGLTSEQAYQAVIEAGFGSADNDAGFITALEHISPGGDAVRLVELPTLELNGQPMRNGANLSANVVGTPGDFESDKLTLDLRLIGIDDKSRYSVRYEVDGDPTDGSHDLLLARDGDLPYSYVVQHEVDVGFGVPTGEMELTAIVDLPEGGESRYSVTVNVGPGEGTAVVTIGGQTWEFVLVDGFLSGCQLSEDGSQLVAGAWLDETFKVRFSVDLHPYGVGTSERLGAPASAQIRVDDGIGHQSWSADATDGSADTAAWALIPGGSSQVDTLTIEGRHAWGTATFIELGAVRDAWSDHTPLPIPVPGTFDIQCAG